MANKMGKPLVVMCTLALGAIYTTGYVVTKSPNGNPAGTSVTTTSNTSNTSNTSKVSKVAEPRYLDGTYQGSGTDRIGTVSVAVTIQNDKITNVQITACETHYPESYIDPVLPDQVVARQSANVDYVSGATLSSYDFANAVQQALDQALNPKYTG